MWLSAHRSRDPSATLMGGRRDTGRDGRFFLRGRPRRKGVRRGQGDQGWFTTTYWTVVPAYCGWYQTEPQRS